YNCNDSI
ncbi:CPXV166 protein, partial [Monkeypox virus]